MKMLRTITQLALFAVVMAGSTGCLEGYTTRSQYRADVKTVHVPVWTRSKDVYRRGVELRQTEALQKRIEQDTRYRVATKTTADTEIVGRIELIEQQVLSFDTDTGMPREREIIMLISYTWTDLRTGKPIIERKYMRMAGIYRPHEPLSEDFFQGSELVINRIAQRIVEQMAEDW